jgi:hypothetical protein
MEIKKIRINFNRRVPCNLGIYDINSINELEDGTLFGLITNKKCMDFIYPEYKNFNNCIKSVNQIFADQIDLYSCGKDVPLIFKKIGNNLAQELISGQTFLVASDVEEIIGLPEESKNMEEFQNDINTYSKDNVVLLSLAHLYNEDGKTSTGDLTKAIFAVDDAFKVLYYNESLIAKEVIEESLLSLKEKAKSYFNHQLANIAEYVSAIAYTDNFLYDLEHPTKTLVKK